MTLQTLAIGICFVLFLGVLMLLFSAFTGSRKAKIEQKKRTLLQSFKIKQRKLFAAIMLLLVAVIIDGVHEYYSMAGNTWNFLDDVTRQGFISYMAATSTIMMPLTLTLLVMLYGVEEKIEAIEFEDSSNK